MYSLGSTVETSKNDSVFVGQERNCTAIDRTTGEFCGETESLKILDEFQKLYETRIEEVDRELEGEFERVSTKLQIMKEWIRDLGEQNVMLVHTVEDLEQAACSRVKLLEEKLRQSSTIVSENMTKSNHTEKAIDDLSQRVNDLEKDELCMQQKIEYLQSDIRGLLEFIRRARTENRWQLDGIKFFEIEPNDILTPNDCTCGQEETNNEKLQSLKLQVEQLQENERKMIAYQTELKEKITVLTKKLNAKEDSIKKYVSQLQSYSGNIKKHSKFPDQVICNSLATNEEQQSPDDAYILQNVSVNKNTFKEEQIISYLIKTKSLMEKENEALFDLKIELERIVEKLHFKEKGSIYDKFLNIESIYEKLKDIERFLKTYKSQVIGHPESVEDLKKCIESLLDNLQSIFQDKLEYQVNKNEFDINGVTQKLSKNIESVQKMCSDKEKAISMIDSIMDVENNSTCIEIANVVPTTDEYSISFTALKKKIIELENAIKTQKETECTLRQHLNDSEMELKRSKELLNSLHTEHGFEGMLLRCRCNQLRHETMNVPQLLKTVQNTMQSAKIGLQDHKIELKRLMDDGMSNSCSSMKSITSSIDKLQKYEDELDSCSEEIDKLKNALCSKDKLIENMDEMIRIQKDSIGMSQTEIKELYRKLQEKIDTQDQVISQHEKEKKELLRQNELQVQTIGHLQNAVVEAKRSIDQMGQKTTSDVSELWSGVSPSIYKHRNVHDV